MIGLTKRQSDALAFISAYITDHGRAPSFQNIAESLGIKVPGARVTELVNALEERGYIRRRHGKRRSIELLPRFKFIPASEVYDNAALLAGRGA